MADEFVKNSKSHIGELKIADEEDIEILSISENPSHDYMNKHVEDVNKLVRVTIRNNYYLK